MRMEELVHVKVSACAIMAADYGCSMAIQKNRSRERLQT